MTYIGRLATNQDMKWIAEIASVRMLSEELNRPELVNLENIYSLVKKGVEEKTCFVVENEGELVGVLGSFLIRNLFNPKIKVLTEVFWYVLPEHRKSRAGYLLFKQFKDTADIIADESTMSLLPASSDLEFESLEKRGYRLEEFGFTRRKM